MKRNRFFNKPFGVSGCDIPSAHFANLETTSLLVQQTDEDSRYFRMLEKEGIRLNKEQIIAVRHVEGPFLTLAGAGTGKTTVLVCRAGYLLTEKSVLPEQLLLVTFTKKAADEIKERIGNLPNVSKRTASLIQASTFHSFFLFVLRKKGYTQDILSNDRHKHIILKKILREKGLSDDYQPEVLLSLLSHYKMNMLNIDNLPDKSKQEKEIKEILHTYEKWKLAENKMDFDDILVLSYDLLNHDQLLLEALQQRFQYVMVDEFQDTNTLQYELIQLLIEKHQNFFVVGDDDQTIYTFNGANQNIILNFEKQHHDAKRIALTTNYRSSNSIVGLGNEIIRHNKKRLVKTLCAVKMSSFAPQYISLSTTDEEASVVVETIKEKVLSGKYRYADIAILHRAASNSRAVFEQLAVEKVPFIHYGLGEQIFYEHWAIRPIIDHLRLSLVPRDFDAITGVLPTLYINKEKGIQFIRMRENEQRKKYPLIHLKHLSDLRDFQKKALEERIRFIKDLQNKTPLDAIKLIRSSFYDKYIETDEKHQATIHKETLREMLDELESSSKRFDTIDGFLTFILDMITLRDEMKQSSTLNAVSLMTIHRSKGLEFPVVFIIGASEKMLPHSSSLDCGKLDSVADSNSLEEERRLAYVAVTRAKDELYISSPNYYRGEKVSVSRFFKEAFQGVKDSQEIKSELTDVFAWVCTSNTCHAWVRINKFDNKEKSKICPLCEQDMIQGTKKI
ncbi:DNA helicase UvrD [Bacillus sp. HMF5848]|uniref:UvrD-helicase domain-containing protein n=1 Tax=Bacillus sp. HMF5848 TaxID=2495421 RepID=UPI000F7825F6|nr:UvrD-helicase domain-containing protein [Bacillus sp. HMF5848]RSK26778.1 DNA helicase UvrD [Bacillus sp. HMF5848]